MLRHPYLLSAIALSLFLSLLVSCDDYSFSESTSSQDASVVLQIEGIKSSKHIEADVSSVSGAYYQITGTGPANKGISRTVNASESSVQIFSGLNPGQWTFDVSLRTKAGVTILRGESQTNLSNGSNELSVNLSEVEGKGSLVLSASISGLSSVPQSMTVDCTLTGSSGNQVSKIIEISSSGTGSVTFANLDSGYYDLSLILRDMAGYKVGGAAETVRIISSLQSYGSVTIPVTGQDADDYEEDTYSSLNLIVKSALPVTEIFTISKNGSRLAPVFDSDVSDIVFSSCSFQWYEDGEKITGARSSSYILSRNSGRWRYDLVVTFSDGRKSSAGINIQF
ncbi:MAG: hypothetical protein K6F82_03915 [Sphaerochaetaceae bacterium]|nr:hypothetical protein [Sphaerochaetaceae bacterium]